MIMDRENIKSAAFSGGMWKFLERIIAEGVTLIVSLVIARILSPSDYGVVSLVTIFFTFANVLISGGLNTALIQNKNSGEEDYNTVFTVSIIVALLLYLLMYFFAPIIALKYGQEILCKIIRVMGLSLPVYALKSIVCAYISSNLLFKKFFFATLGGTLCSAVIGITMAYSGFGPWALVAQQLTNTIIDTIILFFSTGLRLKLFISVSRFKRLFGYGWKIMVSSFISTLYSQINPLFVGIKYSSADLSFYSKGQSFPIVLSSSITNTLSSVLFPVLARFQNDRDKLLRYTRLFMRVASYVVFPAMLGFFAIADNFISALLTDKWIQASFYIRIFCVSYMFDVVAIGNCETIKAMGRSDVFLKLELLKKSCYFIVIAIFLFFSVSPEQLAYSALICTAIQVLINSLPNKKLLNYTLAMQIKDLFPNLLISIIMCVSVIWLGEFINASPVVNIFVQVIFGGIVYLILSLVTKNSSFVYLYNLLKQKLGEHNSRRKK